MAARLPNSTEGMTRLRAARLARSLSMMELARKAGISRTTLYFAERAPEAMSDDTKHKLAKALRLPLKEFIP